VPQVRYWPELDGVRALAIALVLAYHADRRLAGGILGVDLFFVLSGFLITTLLLQERVSTGRIAVGRFYVRRALRLLPALGVALILVTLVDRLPGALPTDIAFGIPFVVIYAINWADIYSTPRLGTLVPYWSLAIEEQFYLVWPWVIRRWAHARRLAETLAAIAFVIMFARTGWSVLRWRGSDRITFFRADGLILGAALAVLIARREARTVLRALTAPRLPYLALAGIAVAWVGLVVRDGPETRSAAYACASIAGTALIGSVVLAPASPVARVLRTRPLVAVGKVSYGIYLYNYPIFTVVQSQSWSTPTKLIVEFSATAALTLASWRFVERPAQRLRRKLATPAAAT
jgi:peptidoglycan/LPS O-acetylase OafA/YrhL